MTGSPPYPHFPHPQVQPTTDQKHLKKKTPENSKVPNLNLPNTGNYLHIIYIVLGIISKLRDDLNGIIANSEYLLEVYLIADFIGHALLAMNKNSFILF